MDQSIETIALTHEENSLGQTPSQRRHAHLHEQVVDAEGDPSQQLPPPLVLPSYSGYL